MENKSINIILIDINEKMCQEWSKYAFPDRVKIFNGSIDQLKLNGINIFVSPANSLGLMRGGIDKVYCEMFPSIEMDVRKAIHKLGLKNNQGSIYLPVGSALFVEVSGDCVINDLKNCKNYFICAPSMSQPGSNIKGTNNAYHCYKSIITLIKKLPVKINNVILPGIGTGVGGLTTQQCATQLYRALTELKDPDESPKSQILVLKSI